MSPSMNHEVRVRVVITPRHVTYHEVRVSAVILPRHVTYHEVRVSAVILPRHVTYHEVRVCAVILPRHVTYHEVRVSVELWESGIGDLGDGLYMAGSRRGTRAQQLQQVHGHKVCILRLHSLLAFAQHTFYQRV